MAQIKFKGVPIHTVGNLPALNNQAPDFRLVDRNLKDRTLSEFFGKKKILSTVPSLDTGVCSKMTKHLNDLVNTHPNLLILTVSADLPFAQNRFCETEKTQHVLTLSMMRDKEFGKAYGILIQDGPLAGVLARSVLLIDEKNTIVYSELVPEITQEPNYQKLEEILLDLFRN